MQHSQQRVAPCVEGVKGELGTRALRMVAAFWAGILVENTQETGVVHVKDALPSGHSFNDLI